MTSEVVRQALTAFWGSDLPMAVFPSLLALAGVSYGMRRVYRLLHA